MFNFFHFKDTRVVIIWFCRYAKEVCDAIVAKCLTGRPKTVEKAQMVFMLWVELEAVDAFLVSLMTNSYFEFDVYLMR